MQSVKTLGGGVSNRECTVVLVMRNSLSKGPFCRTSSDDLLVTMYCAISKRTKIMRYHGYIEKQIIQVGGKTDLHSPGHYTKYITENRNLDICVADNGAGAVVVVTKAGKLRLRYTGLSSRKGKFDPVGIASDS